jgi:hypothetical protein
VVDLVDQLPNDPLEHAEIQDKQAFGIDRALDRDPDPVVMAVQRLALVAPERDEMGRREHEVVFTDFDAKLALHWNALGLKTSHASR